MDCPFHDVQIVFCCGIGKVRNVDCRSADISHNFAEIFGCELCAECRVDCCDELFVCLIFGKAAHELGNKIRLSGIIGKRKHIQYLRLLYFTGEAGGFHLIFYGVHGILNKLQLLLFLGREVFYHHRLQTVGVNLDAAIEDRDNRHDGHNDNNDNPKHNAEYGFQYLGIRKQ